MSLVSSFISNHLLSLLETEFVNNEPVIQEVILSELQAFVGNVGTWVESKMHPSISASVEPSQGQSS